MRYLIGAYFEHNVDIQMIIKMSSEFDNVLMVEALMDFYLTAELLLRSFFGERTLLYYLDGFNLFGIVRDELVAASETPFA